MRADMTRRAVSGIAAFLLALGLAMCAFVSQAHAITPDEGKAYDARDSTTFSSNPANVAITKVLAVGEASLPTSGIQFMFSFAAQDGTGTTASEAPAIESRTATALAMTGTVDSEHTFNSSRDEQYILVKGFIPQASAFPHAGEYVYRITENSAETPAGMVYSQAEYLMRVYVVNEGNSLAIQTITVDKVINDDGSVNDATSNVDQKKVDPEPKTPTPNEGTYSGLMFVNTYTKSAPLLISKSVTGDSADKTLGFAFTATLTAPSIQSIPSTVKATIDGTSTNVTCTLDETGHTLTLGDAPQGSSTRQFTLAHGQTLRIEGLPVGTSFVVTELESQGYTASATVTHDGATASKSNAAANTALVIDEDVKGVPASIDPDEFPEASVSLNSVSAIGDSAVAFSNARQDITPTGVIISNLPYILLIGIPLIALVVWFTMRSRRSSRR